MDSNDLAKRRRIEIDANSDHDNSPSSVQPPSPNDQLTAATTSSVEYVAAHQTSQINITGSHVSLGGDVVVQPFVAPQESTPQTSIEVSTATLEQRAIEELVEMQEAYRESDVEVHGFDVSVEEMPVVHPQMEKVAFYRGEAAPKNEEYKPLNQWMEMKRGRECKYEELLEQGIRFIGLIGYPGSGKTTCSKRLARSDSRRKCFHMKFMNMNYDDERKLTVKELLIDNVYPDLNETTRQHAFNWIRKNQSQCVFIIDGYDQAEWSMRKVPPKEGYDVPQKTWQLVASLCNKHYLPEARLVITSRPHSMIRIPPGLRPNLTIFLKDFAFRDMKSLFFFLAADRADDLWKSLNAKAPQLVSFCHNPMMLHYVVRATLQPSQALSQGDIVTMTRVFFTVLENLRRSDHARNEDIYGIMNQLGSLAFKATQRHTVVITIKDLAAEGLTIEMVQDLVIAVQGFMGLTSRVFEGDTKLYFTHQCLQEYFTAFYIRIIMTLDDFKHFSQTSLFTSHWLMVRRYLCGLLVDPELSRVLDVNHLSDETQAKRGWFTKCLKEEFSRVSTIVSTDSDLGATQVRRDLMDIINDIRECNSDNVTAAMANCFPSNARFIGTPVTSSDAYAIGYLFQKISSKIDWLGLSDSNLNSHSFADIASGIELMPGSIVKVDLPLNHFDSSTINTICRILHKIESRLSIQSCILGSDGHRRDPNEEEIKKLQDALNAIPQTNLEIVVGFLSSLRKTI